LFRLPSSLISHLEDQATNVSQTDRQTEVIKIYQWGKTLHFQVNTSCWHQHRNRAMHVEGSKYDAPSLLYIWTLFVGSVIKSG